MATGLATGMAAGIAAEIQEGIEARMAAGDGFNMPTTVSTISRSPGLRGSRGL
jgi:hypothetical protein